MEKRVKFTLEAKKSLQSLHIDAQKSIKSALKKLSKGEIAGKALTERLEGLNSLIVGNYRAIYQYTKDRIIVFDVGHRKSIYGKVESRMN
jgi:addiction module RelE/StbE family toxin